MRAVHPPRAGGRGKPREAGGGEGVNLLLLLYFILLYLILSNARTVVQ